MKKEYGGLMYGIAGAIFFKTLLLPDTGKIVYLLAILIGGSLGFFIENYLLNKPKKR